MRPSWITSYGRAELHAITSIVRDRLGDSCVAEAATYHALAALPRAFARNRAFATARLALAQLHQGDLDQAVATTAGVFPLLGGGALPGRLRTLLGDFYRDLITTRPHCAGRPGVGRPQPHRLEPHMTPTLNRYGHTELSAIRQTLLDVHADAYADQMDDPFHQTEKFAWFVDHWGTWPSFDCVIAFDDGQPAGFAYNATAGLGRET